MKTSWGIHKNYEEDSKRKKKFQSVVKKENIHDAMNNNVPSSFRVVTWNAGSGITGHGIEIRDLGIGINAKSQKNQDQTFPKFIMSP